MCLCFNFHTYFLNAYNPPESPYHGCTCVVVGLFSIVSLFAMIIIVTALIGDYFNTSNMFPIGALMEKGLHLAGGQLFCQKYWKFLLEKVGDSCYFNSFEMVRSIFTVLSAKSALDESLCLQQWGSMLGSVLLEWHAQYFFLLVYNSVIRYICCL